MTKNLNNIIQAKIDAKVKGIEKAINDLKSATNPNDINSRLFMRGRVDGLNEAREIFRLEVPDKDNLAILIELLRNAMDKKPQPVQVQNFELYAEINSLILVAPRKYIMTLMAGLDYFRNRLN